MLTEEIKKLIGMTGSGKVYEVEKGAISRFADAVDDTNPLYHDNEYARNSRYGSIIAPPGFFGWPLKQARGSPLTIDISAELISAFEKAGYPLSSAIDGSIEYEFFLPVHAGDILTATTTVRNLRERTENTGHMLFIILETTFRNQSGALTAIQQATITLHSSNDPPKEQVNA
jgi:acyl dehydratase